MATSSNFEFDEKCSASVISGRSGTNHQEILTLKPEFARELSQDGLTPLHIASAKGHVEIVRELLKVGHDLSVLRGKDGRTALHYAATKGRIQVLKELISTCPECLKEVTTCDETAIHLAVKCNQIEAAKFLMEEIKRIGMMEIVNWKDKDGNAILHLAVFRKQPEIISLLTGHVAIVTGVEMNSKNASGFTPKDVLDFNLHSGGDYRDFTILEKFQQARALKSREIAINSDSPPTEVAKKPSLPLSSSNLWREIMKEIEESSVATQNALMVVAVLIATVTYQATLSPPSGYWSAETRRFQFPINNVDHRKTLLPGEAIMSGDHEVFAVFTIFNGLGFFASMAMISLITSGFPLRAGLRLAILSMTATYVISVVYMSPTDVKTINIVVALVSLLVLVELARFMTWLLKKLGIPVRRTRRRRGCEGGGDHPRV
ncbi:hypothetical protein K2173_011287 [Erythroxylum novogranatense]|uniref:PGG domain-containing protein n=1 Tax=Erythroxylum novogranatense TaxID=1862640 RepID=A0AAV8S999_9ROSI|nr:hypothetical protein K2173_011287 [Erythroxylum novogranatense]